MELKIILASKNQGKIKEFNEILKPLGYEVLGLDDINFEGEIIEDGNSFYENALIKAKALYEKLLIPVIADDSGLCVKALNGAPGIYSARYLGLDSDLKRSEALLKNLEGIKDRSAYFICTIVYYDGSLIKSFEGRLEGFIGNSLEGHNGFGYDPVFRLPDGTSLANLSSEEKNAISHRGKAIEKFREWIR